MQTTFVLMFTFLFFISAQTNQDQERFHWQLRKKSSGILVYTSDVQGSNIKAFKAEMELEATGFDNILAPILDVGNYDQLIPNCKDPQLLDRKGDWYYKYYSISTAPWPVSDRDGVYEQKARYIEQEKCVQIEISTLNGEVDKKDGIVRMTKGNGFWKIRKMDASKYHIIYVFHADPGGNIPGWLANTSVVDIPFKLFRNLNDKINKPQYSNANFSFTPEE